MDIGAGDKADLIVITGDLIDYNRGLLWTKREARMQNDLTEHYYWNVNWLCFYEMLLDTYKKPVFTLLGNHDWRLNPYTPLATVTKPLEVLDAFLLRLGRLVLAVTSAEIRDTLAGIKSTGEYRLAAETLELAEKMGIGMTRWCQELAGEIHRVVVALLEKLPEGRTVADSFREASQLAVYVEEAARGIVAHVGGATKEVVAYVLEEVVDMRAERSQKVHTPA